MSPDTHVDADVAAEGLDPQAIAQRQFSAARRGLDPGEVRAYLQHLAEAIDGLRQREAEALQRADEAERRARAAEHPDQHRLMELLGDETARVLDAARDAAAEIREKAEESAARLISEATEQAHQLVAEGEADLLVKRTQMMAEVSDLRTQAEGELERRRADADEVVAEMRREAELAADGLRQEGEDERARASADADRLREAAREESRRMVAEAQTMRERVLSDLSRRRRASREQLERLNGARDRLLAAYEVVRRTVDEATAELNMVLPEAKIAGDNAMRRVQREPELTLEELESQVSMARITGLLPALEEDPELDALLDPPPETEAEPETEPAKAPAISGPEEQQELLVAARPETMREPPESEDRTEPADAIEPDIAEADGSDELEPPVQDEGQPLNDPLTEVPERDADGANEPDNQSELVDPVAAEVVAAHAWAEPAEPDGADEPAEFPQPEPEGAQSGPAHIDELFARLKGDVPSAPPDDVLLRQRDETLEPLERALARRLKRVLADEQNEVLDLVRRSAKAGPEDDELLPDPDTHADRYAQAASDELHTAAYWGAASVEGELSSPCDDLALELSHALTQTLRERMARSFEESEGDADELTDRLRALYRECKNQRIGEVVQHYVAAAYAFGAYDAAPDEAFLRWVVDTTGAACPDAEDNALAGPQCKGEAFPTGHCAPPAHPGCRCLIVPAEPVTTQLAS